MNIIINGGTRGIGKELTLGFSKSSSNLIIVTGRNEASLKTLGTISDNIIPVMFDITSPEAAYNEFFERVRTDLNKADILINCAGLLRSRIFMETNESDARAMMETNFFGPARLIRTMKPLMSQGSHIVNITSMGGFQGSTKFPGMSYYSASKAALSCLSECLAAEFSGSEISVNALAIGAVQTEMLEEAFPGYKAPVSAIEMAEFIIEFASTGHRLFNGKVLPVAVSNP